MPKRRAGQTESKKKQEALSLINIKLNEAY